MMRAVEKISEIAVRWVVRADAGALTPAEEHELTSWLAADSRHRGAYVRARAGWVDLDRLAAMRGPARGAQERFSGVSFAEHSEIAANAEKEAGMLSRRELLAAGIAAVSGGVAWMLFSEGLEHYASGVGEVRRIALEDGSTLLINTSSEVSVRLTKEQRQIHLIRGEAHFEVARDKSRPFIVQVNGTEVRAVGTAFAVRLEAAQVDVTVTEGVVEVADSADLSGRASMLQTRHRREVKRVIANERAVIARVPNRSPEVEAMTAAQADRQLAWREGMVSFDGESLQTAVAEINRHNRRQIVIEDTTLGQLPVIGLFRATDIEGFSEAAATALKARAIPDGQVIRLRRGVSAQGLN